MQAMMSQYIALQAMKHTVLVTLLQLCDNCLAPDTDNDGTGCDNMTCIIAMLKPVGTDSS